MIAIAPVTRCSRITYTLFLIGFLFARITLAEPVSAQSGAAMELINEVNALRASLGLAPYSVDGGLVAYAQEHAAYLASTKRTNHIHKDGSIPWDIGLSENVASGEIGYITPHGSVFSDWADEGHRKTMVGYPSGSIGAGVASDGSMDYYVIDVRPGSTATSSQKSGTPHPTANSSASPMPQFGILNTVTPLPDGSIIHIVGYGQTLSSIAKAYSVKVEDIQKLNGYQTTNTTIYEFQKLIIRGPVAVTPTPTATRDLPTTASLTPILRPALTATGTFLPDKTQTPTQSPPGSGSIFTFSPLASGLLGFVGGVLLTLLVMHIINLKKL